MLTRLYNWVLTLASHKHAMLFLWLIAFAESSFFPIPPDPIIVAMTLADRKRAFRIALISTTASVLGGFLGYAIGYGLYETLGHWIVDSYGLNESFIRLKEDFNQWGFWIIALKGLTPIPYKIVTIASGVTGLNLLTFTTASLIARGFRFYLMAWLLWYYGDSIKVFIEKNLTLVTLTGISVLIAGFIILKFVT